VLSAGDVVVLLDVDNTLLDNDRFGADLSGRLESLFGAAERDRYWAIYSARRDKLSYADYLGALQEFRFGLEDDPNLLQMSSYLLEYPFADRLFPHALDVISHLRTLALPIVLSDGDVVFQPRKIERSGIWNAVDGRVLIDVHKDRALDPMRRRYPARHYVMVDDKPGLLASMKKTMGSALTTLFVCQGHYAAEYVRADGDPLPDLEIERIAELLDRDLSDILATTSGSCATTTQEST
jgi:FMN phosphatase YigB (HAD superfamily)